MAPAGAGDDLYGVREIWPAGTVLKGDYVIERKLGGGGFGSVYLARHRYLNSLHVIKRMHQNLQEQQDFVRKFFKEGQLMTRLKDCPYIVQVQHMTHTDDNHLILVMEHIDGGDLAKLMAARTLSVDEVVEYGRQIAKALAAAHAVGVIHRDIKPENALLTKDSSGRPLVKLIDFGIAADHAGSQHTSVVKMGSIGFAAPEQWMKAGKDIDGRADIYALAATMYRLLCGRMPYEGATEPWPWLMRVQQGPPDAPGSIRSDCPGWLSDALMKALAALPENRPATAMEFQDLLKPPPVATVVEQRVEEPLVEVAPAQPEVVARRSSLEPKPGEVQLHVKDGLPYVYIPPGTFRMGDDDFGPAHYVTLTKGFWMTQTPVTVAAYKRYCHATGTSMPSAYSHNENWSLDTLPMTMVSWHDAEAYCNWARLRLPTEAEWEYAARAGTSGLHYGKLEDIAWCEGAILRPVGHKLPNGFKLHDMLGNAWEWTADWYAPYETAGSAVIDPKGPSNGQTRVLRGASCYGGASLVRASIRHRKRPTDWSFEFGFRCVAETLIH